MNTINRPTLNEYNKQAYSGHTVIFPSFNDNVYFVLESPLTVFGKSVSLLKKKKNLQTTENFYSL